MKILVLSDLHLHFYNKETAVKHYKKVLHGILDKEQFDCVVISGDILESEIMHLSKFNPYLFLHDLFENEYPIICCLGNHEFAYSFVKGVKGYYNSFKERYNIHYLDIEDKFEFNGINFVGNVFWYDNSLAGNPLSKPDFILPSWLDSTIRDFKPSVENKKCQEQILNNIDSTKENILVTHTVPHYKMNWFSLHEPTSFYNQYSGNKDFLQELHNVTWSISGHTHKRIMDTIHGINCVNIGNDYLADDDIIRYYVIDTQESHE